MLGRMNPLLKQVFKNCGIGKKFLKESFFSNKPNRFVDSVKLNKSHEVVFVKSGLCEDKTLTENFIVESTCNVFKMNFPKIEAKNLLPCDLIINESGQIFDIDYIYETNEFCEVGMINEMGEELIEVFVPHTIMGFIDNIEESSYSEYGDKIEIYEDKDKKVKLNKIMRGDVKKYKVYVKNDKGNVVKVNFGDPNMDIKRDDPARRKNFRARHNCDNPGPRWKAKYWACKTWSSKPVSSMLKENTNTCPKKWEKTVKELSETVTKNFDSKKYNNNLFGLVARRNLL